MDIAKTSVGNEIKKKENEGRVRVRVPGKLRLCKQGLRQNTG